VATVTLYNPDRTVRFTARPFGSSYTGGVRVAVGDVTGDGVPDVVAGSSGGIAAQLRIIDGATGTIRPEQLFGDTSYTGYLSVSAGDVTGDGVADIAVGTNEGRPRARVFRGGDFAKLAEFNVGPTSGFMAQTQVALADVNADGTADLVVSARYSNGTRFFGFDGDTLRPSTTRVRVFNTFTLSGSVWANGLFLSAGDVNADGFADLVLGTRPGDSQRVIAYSGNSLVASNARVKVADFVPAGASSTTGVWVSTRDVNGDGVPDILTASGELVTAYRGGNLPPTGPPPALLSFDPDPAASGGVFVG
jgi:hypothetical protein